MKINNKLILDKEQLEDLKSTWDENKKIHDELLLMIKEIDATFKKVQIPYVMTAGTLLGAHLYEDFIPWDDDMDLAISFDDYQKFVTEFSKHLPKHLELLSCETQKNYLYPFPKIINKNVPLSKKEMGEKKSNSYLFIDVTTFKSTKLNRQPFSIRFWGKYMWLRNSEVNKIVDFLKYFFKIIPTSFIYKRIYKKISNQKPGENLMEPFPYTKDVKHKMSFNNLVYLNFRGLKLPAPNNYIEWLHKNYAKENTSIYHIPKKKITHGLRL